MTQQGGGVSPSSKTVKLGDNYGDLPTPTRTGYTFNSWKNSDGTAVTSTTQNTTIGDHTLTANWTANNYTLTLYENKNILNGGELTTTQDLYMWNDNKKASLVTEDGLVCTKISGQFGTTKYFSQSILNKISSNTEYICGIKAKVVNYVAGPTEPFLGIHTNGWYYNNGTNTWLDPGGSHILSDYSGNGWKDVFYHFITIQEVSFVFQTDAIVFVRDCTGDIYFRDFSIAPATNTNKIVSFDSSNYSIAKPTYVGYTFQGYYTQPVGGTKIFNADCSVVKNVSGYTDSNGAWIKAGNVKLYAQWTENNYTLTLYENKNILNGGRLTTSSDLSAWVGGGNGSIVTEDGLVCTKISGQFGTTKYFSQSILNKISSNTEYICGIKAKVVNYVAGPTEPFLGIHTNGWYYNNGTNTWLDPGGSHILSDYSGNGWKDVFYHFITIQEVSFVFQTDAIVFVRDCTGDIYFRDFSIAPATKTTRSVKYSSNSGSVSPLTYSGFTFNGYYTQPVGGVKIYNADGSLVSGVAGYTDSSGAWIRAEDTKLYGQWTQN
ncbi:MAG: InlB B-repeat-containing protein [Christensenellales bacterium]